MTRGYPLDPQPGERVDHPHHVGLWFNYGDVNGLDFWNNSDAIPAAARRRMGTVIHKRVIETTSGKDKGELNVEMDWVDSKGTLLLKENTRFVFQGDAKTRIIDRITRLTAMKDPVVFGDSKEGVLGIRMARSLEQPSNTPDIVRRRQRQAGGDQERQQRRGDRQLHRQRRQDRRRGVGHARSLDDAAGEGRIRSRSRSAILDHPQNPGFPTYWHARGYGLFAANNLGQKVFDPKQPLSQAHARAGRIVDVPPPRPDPGRNGDAAQMAAEHKKFAGQK